MENNEAVVTPEDTTGIITKSEVLRLLSKRMRAPRLGMRALIDLIRLYVELTAVKTTYRAPGQKPLGRRPGKTKKTQIIESTMVDLVKKIEAEQQGDT